MIVSLRSAAMFRMLRVLPVLSIVRAMRSTALRAGGAIVEISRESMVVHILFAVSAPLMLPAASGPRASDSVDARLTVHVLYKALRCHLASRAAVGAFCP